MGSHTDARLHADEERLHFTLNLVALAPQALPLSFDTHPTYRPDLVQP
jgi:hypothetical protein